MSVRRIILVSENRRKLLCRIVEDSIKSWLLNWSFNGEQQVVVESLQEREITLETPCFVFRKESETVFWVNTDVVDWEKILWKSSLPQFPQDRAGKKIIVDAVNAIIVEIMSGLTHQKGGAFYSNEADSLGLLGKLPGDQIIGFDIRIGEQELMFILEVGCWLNNYSSQISSKSDLCKYDVALGNQKTKVTVNLDLGAFDLATIGNMTRGDVLVSEVPLSSLFDVEIAGKQSLKAYLGKAGARKAVQLQ